MLPLRLSTATTCDFSGSIYDFYCKLKTRFKLIQTFSKSQFQNQDNTEDFPKVLGTSWNHADDKLFFTFKNLTSYLVEEIITKPIILSSIAKIFNPLGLLSQVFVAFKILFQEICKKEVDWDTPLGGDRDNEAVEIIAGRHL